MVAVLSVSWLLASSHGRCLSLLRTPLPMECMREGPRWVGQAEAVAQSTRNLAANHWRQPVACCDYQILTLPVRMPFALLHSSLA